MAALAGSRQYKAIEESYGSADAQTTRQRIPSKKTLHNPYCVKQYAHSSRMKGDFQNEDGETHNENLAHHEAMLHLYRKP